MALKKVLVAMSGGVDSSTTAAILKNDGNEVVGVTMQLFSWGNEGDDFSSCCGSGPARDARKVCSIIGIPHRIINAQDLFRQKVIDDFCNEYRKGRTPNPCIRCNTYLKFDLLLQKAHEMGLDFVATGHYAKIANGRLYKGADPGKDQSYFLYTLNKSTINQILFPLGRISKSKTRALAEQFKLPVFNRPESQDICFLPKGRYREFLDKYGIKSEKGPMLDTKGRQVGEHSGLSHYTIGQRKGLGALGERSYVVAIDQQNNTIIVGSKNDLLADSVEITSINICYDPIMVDRPYEVRLRSRSKFYKGRVASMGEDRLTFVFDSPVEAVTPGQAAVLYDRDEVVGGGIISGEKEASST